MSLLGKFLLLGSLNCKIFNDESIGGISEGLLFGSFLSVGFVNLLPCHRLFGTLLGASFLALLLHQLEA